MRKNFGSIIVSFVLMFVFLQGTAYSLNIDSTFLFTQRLGPNGFVAPGWYLQVGGMISPSGPGTTAQAIHIPSGSGPDYNLQFRPQPIFPNIYWYRELYTGQTGRWNINAQEGLNNASATTHLMDFSEELPLASNLAVSGSLLTPTLTWDNIYAAYPTFRTPPIELHNQFYQLRVRVRIAEPGMTLIYESGNLPTTQTSFTLPNGVLEDNQNYLLDLMLMGFDTEEIISSNPWRYITNNENRSETFLPYSTNPVPEPATMLLLGSGLIGLAGYGRKKFLKK